MATESKDVELRVRAKDYSEKTLDKVAKALANLEKAQVAQLKSAKAGTVSARELEKSYADIEKAVGALVKQNAIIKTFETQAAKLDEVKAAADAARVAQTEYANSLAGVDVKTKAQIKTQNDLATAVARADKAQLQAQDRLSKTTARLAQYGISVNQVAAAQQRIVSSVNAGNAALDRQAQALDTVERDIRAAIAAQNEKAAADAQVAAAARAAQAAEEDWRKQRAAMVDQQAKLTAAEKEAAAAEQKMVAAMRASGQQAEASAKGYATLARSVNSVKGSDLANQLRAISDPASVAMKNIDGLEAATTALAAKIKAINGPVKDFRATMQSLEAVQKGATGVATQIDAYTRQIAVLRQARTEYAAARAAVLGLAQQMQASGTGARELGTAMTAAQAQLRSASAAMQEQLTTTRALREGLRTAGVSTSDLASSQTKLVSLVQSSKSSLDQLSDAYRKNGAAVEGASKSQFKFLSGGRTTLSFAQRLRGELLALGTAYIGIQGGINLATGALDAYRTSQKITSQLGAVVGNDAQAIREQWDYLMATANRIGFSFQAAAPAYAKFAIAAKAFGFNMQETRFVFEKFAEAARVAGQSSAEFEGILKAVEQMLSKGTIQAEELRGQLGDRLPGAFTLAAKAAGVTTAEFTKMMEAGAVSAETVLNIARELPNQFQGIDKATQSMAAAEARFQNAAFKFQAAIAENGFADAYTDFLNKLTALMGSDQGAQLAKALSGGFTAVIDVLKFLAENIDTVKLAFSALIGLTVARWAFGAATGLISLLTALRGIYVMLASTVTAVSAAGGVMTALGSGATVAATGVGILRTALLVLVRTIPLLAALTAGIWLATKAYQALTKSKKDAMDPNATKAGDGGATGSFNTGGATGTWDGPTADPGSGTSASKRAAAAALKEQEANQKKLDKAQRTANAKSAKDQLDDRAELIKEEYNLKRDAAKRDITDKELLSTVLKGIDKQEKQAILIDQTKFNSEHAKAGEAAGNKRVQLQEQIKNELLKIQDNLAKEEDKIDKNSTFEERKKSRVDAIAHAYDRLKKTISQLAPLDKAGAAEATKRLDILIEQTQQQEEIKVTAEEVKRLEKELTDQQQLRAQGLEKEKALYDAGITTQEQFLANSAKIQRDGDAATTKAAENLQKFADAAVAANKGVLSITAQSDISTKTTLAAAGSANTGNKINDDANKAQETAITNLVAKRTQAEEIFKAQFDLRMISEDEYAKKVNINADTYNKKIAAQVDLFKAQLEAQRAQGLLDGTLNVERLAALDAQIAKMTLLGIQTKNAAKEADTFQKNLNKFVDSGLDAALGSVAEQLTKMAEGTVSFQDGLKNMGIATLKFVAQFLLEISKAIIKQMLLNALAGSTNPYVSAAGRAAGGVGTPVLHAGGVVGRPGGRQRAMSASWFDGAPKFHQGGLPGLSSNEVPAILEKGEQVLSRNDPNNILNTANKATTEQNRSTRTVLIDDRSRVAEAMAGADGEKVTVEHLRKNIPTLRQWLK